MGWIAQTWRGIMAPEAEYTGDPDPRLFPRDATEPCRSCGAAVGKTHKPSCRAVVRIASVTRAPSREAFLAWREHPVTLFAFAALARAAKEQEAAWAGTSWEGGFADQNLLNELRVRADAYNSMQEADYLGFCEWAGVEPKDGEVPTA